jgi:beta-barrel assembly-enhancing protease
MFNNLSNRAYPQSRSSGKMRIIVALVIAGFSLFSYLSKKDFNEATGETQYVSLTESQEVALGLQAAPELIEQYGGRSSDRAATARVENIGKKLVQTSIAVKTPYQYNFHLLADTKTVNAFALPGGQIFITEALFRRLQTEGQLAGVLGHEIAHVVARHSAQRIAQQELTTGISGAVAVAAYDPDNPTTAAAGAMAQMVAGLVNMKYGRGDELESDALGIQYMTQAGYQPESLVGVMKILDAAAGDGPRQAEFFSTHPNPENRIGKIKETIQKLYPKGLPQGLIP